MRRVVVAAAACAGCYRGASEPVAPPAPPPAKACEIHDAELTAVEELQLRVDGISFATVPREIERLDLVDLHAHVETAVFELAGDVDLADLHLRMREPSPMHGWIFVENATPRRIAADALELDIPLPEGFDPAGVVATVRCAELTANANAGGEFVSAPSSEDLARDTPIPFRAAVDGPVVATVLVPGTDSESLSAEIFEHRGDLVKVRISGRNTVVGWIPASALVPSAANVYGGLLGGFGDVGHRCRAPLVLRVRSGHGVRRVGTLKRGARFDLGERAAWPTEIPIDLHGDIAPFVSLADLAACLEK